MSAPIERERRRFGRDDARPGRRLPVRVRYAGNNWREAQTRNIGVGGAFVTMTAPPPVGAEVTLELKIPSGERVFELTAVVRWVGPDGVGMQFLGVDIDVLLELNDYFGALPLGPT